MARVGDVGPRTDMTRLEPDELRSFLHYGFVPRVPSDLGSKPWFTAAPALPAAREAVDEQALLSRGAEAFRAACADTHGELHIVPLSGGLDSRLILGTLLQLGLGRRMLAVTFGTPGTLDFELGRAVARAAGVRHEALDLATLELSAEGLAGSVGPEPYWVPVFEAHYNAQVPRRYGSGAVYWSGIMANTLNGSRYWPEREGSWEDVRAQFAASNRLVRSVDLCPGFRAESVLPRAPLVTGARLTLTEQIALGVRYPSWYEPCLLTPGFEYRTPFRHPNWVEFTLSLPGHLRRGERFFRRVARHMCPELMRLPAKNQLGLALDAPPWRVTLKRTWQRAERLARRTFPRLVPGPPCLTNYVDFDGQLRRETALRAVVQRLLVDLERRALVSWIDLPALWNSHVGWRANHGQALALLASLEIQLQVREAPASPFDASRGP